MERSISIFELSAENGGAVVNAYGSIIVDNEDDVDDSTTAGGFLIFVRHHSGNILSSVWNSKSWPDLFCLLTSILIDQFRYFKIQL